MKNIIIFFIFLLLSACFFKSEQINTYPYLRESIETFFNQNYYYPSNLNELKQHIKTNTDFNITYSKLNQNKNLLLVDKKNDLLIIDKIENDTIMDLSKFEFCNRLQSKKFPRFYLDNWAIFRDGKRLNINDLDSIELRKIKSKINHFSEQDLPPYERNYDFIKYINNRIYFECTLNEITSYRDSIEYNLKKFSMKNDIDSIYFFTAVKE